MPVTCTLKLYCADIDRGRNMIVEHVDEYLMDKVTYVDSAFLYVKPGLDIEVTISDKNALSDILLLANPIKASADNGAPSNYASITYSDSGVTHYYFIENAKWGSTESVTLKLHLDVLNSFWGAVKPLFTKNTHITRQHRDRFAPNGYRLVDKFDEGLTPVLYTVSREEITQTHNYHWYLIYRSDTAEDGSAVSCYCCADTQIPRLASQSAGTTRMQANQFSPGNYYYLISEDDIADPQIGTEYGVSGYVTIAASSNKPIIKIYRQGDYLRVQRYSRTGVADTGYPFESSLSYVDFLKSRRMYVGTTQTVQISDIEQMTSTPIQAGSIGTLYLNSIDSIDRTDSLIIKIIELAYSPFPVSYTGDYIDIPSGWSYDYARGLFKLSTLSQSFNVSVGTYRESDVFDVSLPLVPTGSDSPSVSYESKLWNSNFYGNYYRYDTNVWELKPELSYDETTGLPAITNHPGITVVYHPSNGINSDCAFNFSYAKGDFSGSDYRYEEDYPGYMTCSRDNEVSLYNNEYLNYLKYGKSYADKATATDVANTWLNSLLSVGQGATSGFLVGHTVGAAVGAAIGMIRGVSNAITSTVKAIDAQQQKEWELQHTVTKISGTNDRDLFKWYSNGHMWHIKKEPSAEMKSLLYALFSRSGYACNEYAVPNTDSRIYWNFLQCTPAFSFDDDVTPTYREYINEIAALFEVGVTIFHRFNNSWALNYEYENWESWVIPTDPYDPEDMAWSYLGYISNPVGRTYRFSGTWSGDRINGISQYMEIIGYATEQDYLDGVEDPVLTKTITNVPSGTPISVSFLAVGSQFYGFNYRIVDVGYPDRTTDWVLQLAN